MERALAYIKSRQIWRAATIFIGFVIAGSLLYTLTPRESFVTQKTESLLDTTSFPSTKIDESSSQSTNTYGEIKDKVAVISDTQYTPRLIPLILHFHAVLGPSWPIILYTSPTILSQHLSPTSPNRSAIWQRAVKDGRIQVRLIPEEFNLTSRNGVNLYLSRPWLWEQLAPAQHVLIFQTDAILCANAHSTVDDFMEWDWIAAPLHGSEHLYNGGLSLRNRTMMLDILREGNNWEEETASGEWTMGGEDVWFSRKMDLRGAKLPSFTQALKFACQHEWHVSEEREPLGYHKVHKNIPNRVGEIEKWCPEITLTAPGTLEPST
ncbi:hypothetical protein EG329_004195 [Mollisiaceae sp. DMI_Dod_QoI]|nr:hypothetical protein EG329_004195 [Helotiales sp. DMI_Dod_QoI]